MRLASRFGRINQIRRDRPLTHEELMQYTPRVFGEEKHASRSERYAYIPTITLLENGIDGDVKLNRALWVMAEQMQQALS